MKQLLLLIAALLVFEGCDLKKIPIEGPNIPVTFNKAISGSSGRAYFPWDIVVTPDSGFVLAGFSEGNNNRQCFILRLNARGDTVWPVQDFGGSYGDQALSVALASDGGFVTCGITQEAKSGGSVDPQGYLTKFDANGKMVWEKFFGDTDKSEAAFGIVPMAGGQFLIGYTTITTVIALHLLRITADGGTVADHLVTTANQFYPQRMIKASDGSIVIVGADITTNSLNIVKCQEDGTKIWNYPISSANPTNAPGNDILELANNKLFSAGYKPENVNDFCLFGFSGTGVAIWPQPASWGYGNDDELFSIDKTTDGEIAVMGFSASFTGTPVLYLAKCHAADGSLYWEGPRDSTNTMITSIEISSIWGDMELCSDGGFVMCAASPTGGSMLVVKTDSDGIIY